MKIITTTIQISVEIQKKLFQFINKMEKKLGRRITYNEAIQYLLESQEPKFNRKKFLQNIEKYFGMLK